MSEKSTVYNPKIVEDSYYKIWEDRGYFEIDGNKNIQKKRGGRGKTGPLPPGLTEPPGQAAIFALDAGFGGSIQ